MFNIGHSMKSPARGANRDLGLVGGSGKGDANRSFTRQYQENLEQAQAEGEGWGTTLAKCSVKETPSSNKTTYIY